MYISVPSINASDNSCLCWDQFLSFRGYEFTNVSYIRSHKHFLSSGFSLCTRDQWKMCKGLSIKAVFKQQSPLQSLLSHVQDLPDPNKQKCVVHKNPCECSAVYIGETGRQLKVWHKRVVQKVDTTNAIACHVRDTGHHILCLKKHENNIYHKRSLFTFTGSETYTNPTLFPLLWVLIFQLWTLLYSFYHVFIYLLYFIRSCFLTCHLVSTVVAIIDAYLGVLLLMLTIITSDCDHR